MVQLILVYIIISLAVVYTLYKSTSMFFRRRADKDVITKCAGCSGACTLKEKLNAK